MITASGLELRAGARILLSDTTLRVQPGDRIGLVGRNGAGKTTTLKVLAGEGQPYAGQVDRRSPVGYLPQDPRTGDLEVTGRDRVLSARGLDVLMAGMQELEAKLADGGDEKLVRRYGALEDQFAALGGYAAEAEAARICANLGLPDRALAQTIGTLSGGQRRRIELARILFRDAGDNGGGILLLDEPTNHLDADSITWLRGFLANHKGGLVVISTMVTCWNRSSTRSGSSTPPGPWSTSTTWAGRRTWRRGRPTSGVAAGSGPTPRRRPGR